MRKNKEAGRYWNERVQGLSPYVPGEQPQDQSFIKLNTNENPYPPSPQVIEAIRGALGPELRLYPDPECRNLRRVIAEKYGVSPEEVFPGNGSDEVLAFVFAAFFESSPHGEAREILFPDITYSFYPVYGKLWNIPYRTIPLDDDFSIRGEDYRIPAGGVIFPNPNAPTGRALSLDHIRDIAAYQEKAGAVVVVDEAYGAFGGESAAPEIRRFPNLLTVHTLSKAASLAGLRVGFAIGDRDLIRGLCRVRDSFNSYTLDRLAQAGAVAAILDDAYYQGINNKVIATRERVSKALGDLGFEVLPSSANFIFIRLPSLAGSDFFQALRDRGFLVRHFNRERIRDYLRVSMGTDPEMDQFVAQCAGLIASRKKSSEGL